jgi:hypothetical protein
MNKTNAGSGKDTGIEGTGRFVLRNVFIEFIDLYMRG